MPYFKKLLLFRFCLFFALIVIFQTYSQASAKYPSFTADEGTKQTIIWGYNNSLVIAKVINAGYNQVFYTSFEEESTLQEVYYARTGRKVKSGSFYIPYGKRPQSGIYLLSYWERINNKWQYQEREITYNPTDDPVENAIINTTNDFDEVRMHPQNAMMTTYTYDPLIGKTSETGPNGSTIRYEYDQNYRLKFVLDQDASIIKNYYYHYKGN